MTTTRDLAIQMALFGRAIELIDDFGMAVAGSNTALIDTNKNWEVSMWKGAVVHIFISGIEYTSVISNNTANTLVIALPTGVACAYGCLYAITRSNSIYTGAPLTGAGVYTSDWMQHRYLPASTTKRISPLHYLTGFVVADQAGTINVEYSVDGISAQVTESFPVPANVPVDFHRRLMGTHVRVRYVNGAVAQTSFNLAAWLTKE